MPRPRLTTTETQLVERYVSVLDHVSRCAQAIDRGDWFYLYDKAAQLERHVKQLRETAAENWQAIERGRAPKPRTEAVLAAVAEHGRHYRAAQVLHPESGERR